MNTTAHSVAGSCQVASVVAGAGGVWFPPPLLQRTPLAVSPLTVNDGPDRWAPKTIRATYRTLGECQQMGEPATATRTPRKGLCRHSPGMRRRGKSETRRLRVLVPSRVCTPGGEARREQNGMPRSLAGVAPGPHSSPSPCVSQDANSAQAVSVPRQAAWALF